MEKMKMHSHDMTQENIARIRELFPGCVTEAQGNDGKIRLAVDFDQLRQELSDTLIEGPQERYRLDWPGKREALLAANAPIAKTLRPCREESVDFDTTKNLFIEGDNLDALKLLQETYLGKVKMIYIDPPYNTGNDFIYNDDFSQTSDEFLRKSNQKDDKGNRFTPNTATNGRFHSRWLSTIYSVLKLARNLLSDDGAIVVHIDEHEYPNLEKILAEIYGEHNNLGTIIWDKRNPKGDAIGVAQQHESISLYCKDKYSFKNNCPFKRKKQNAEKMLEQVKKLIKSNNGITNNAKEQYKKWLATKNFSNGEKAYNLIDDNGEIYRPVSMAWPNKKKAPINYFTPLIHPVTRKVCPIPERGWRNPPETMYELQKNGLILFGPDERTQPTRKYLLKDNLYENVPSLLYYGGSDDTLLSSIDIPFDNPKPVAVSKRLIESVSCKNDTILDFFAGSSTTAHAVMQLNAEDGGNRQFIMVQIPEPCDENSEAYKAGYTTIAEISKERIRRSGRKILEGECHEGWNKDIGFRVLKVDTSNMADVYYTPDALSQQALGLSRDNIKPDRTSEDLLFQVLLDWGVDLSLPVHKETIQGKTVFFVNTAPYDLMACFDDGVDEALVRELATFKPLRMVFRDTGFTSDAVKINVDQIFRQMSPDTEVKSI